MPLNAMNYKVLYFLCALLVYTIPVAQETANIESGKIMLRLIFKSDTLNFYFDSETLWEKALQEIVFDYEDFWIENFSTIKNDQISNVALSLFLDADKHCMTDELGEHWRCIGSKECSLECIEQEINVLWVNWKSGIP